MNVIAISEMDKKGRITVPARVRKELDIEGEGSLAFIKERDGRITIKPADKV